MTNTSSQKKRRISTPIMIAIISLMGICVTTLGAIIVGTFPNILDMLALDSNKAEEIIFRVSEINGKSVPQAKIILLSGDEIHIQYTDSNGTSTFNLIKAENLRVFVETEQYEIYDQVFTANTPNPIEIRLNPKGVSKKSIIIRVVDNDNDKPINGAEVILIVDTKVYSQATDSNGITKFTLEFPTDQIDGDISVSFDGFNAEHQRVTLQADRVQDIRLDKNSETITIGFTGEGKVVAKTPETSKDTNNQSNNSDLDNFSCSSVLLSPEELANCGTHQYQIIIDVNEIGNVDCGYDEGTNNPLSNHWEGTEEISIGFSIDSSEVVLSYPEGNYFFSKVKNNLYKSFQQFEDQYVETMITFLEKGFESNSNNVHDTFTCAYRFQNFLLN